MIKIKYSTDSIQWFVTPPPKVVLKNNLNTTALKSKLSDSSTISNPTLITQNIINYDSIAAIDSKNYYKHDLGASATGIAALILTPLGGLILAIPTSMMPPNKENLGKLRFPENNNYMRNYEKQAFKIKRKRVWKAYAIGSAINIIFISGILALKFL
ncbi:MAG: hypothetical protein JSU07_11025 [Bacteroidetes bacterium]|nr:hypothetical protein [Bacteroidota bacterium]